MIEKHYSVAEVADLLSVSEDWVRRQIGSSLVASKRGNRIMITESSIQKMLDGSRVGGSAVVTLAGRSKG